MLDRTNLLQRFDIQLLLVAKDDVAILLVGNILLLEVHDVLQRQCTKTVIGQLVYLLVESQTLGRDIGIEDAHLRGALARQLLGETFFRDAERCFAGWHLVDNLLEVVDAVHHLVVLCDDMCNEQLLTVFEHRLEVVGSSAVSQSA